MKCWQRKHLSSQIKYVNFEVGLAASVSMHETKSRNAESISMELYIGEFYQKSEFISFLRYIGQF